MVSCLTLGGSSTYSSAYVETFFKKKKEGKDIFSWMISTFKSDDMYLNQCATANTVAFYST